MISLSDATRQRLHSLFSGKARDVAELHLLESCGDNLPGVATDYLQLAERIRFAVLKLSGGDLNKLQAAIEGAALDWRDILVAAGFASDKAAHLAWQPDCNQNSQ